MTLLSSSVFPDYSNEGLNFSVELNTNNQSEGEEIEIEINLDKFLKQSANSFVYASNHQLNFIEFNISLDSQGQEITSPPPEV